MRQKHGGCLSLYMKSIFAWSTGVLVKVNGKHPPTLKVPQVFFVEHLKVLGKLSRVAPVLKVRGQDYVQCNIRKP